MPCRQCLAPEMSGSITRFSERNVVCLKASAISLTMKMISHHLMRTIKRSVRQPRLDPNIWLHSLATPLSPRGVDLPSLTRMLGLVATLLARRVHPIGSRRLRPPETCHSRQSNPTSCGCAKPRGVAPTGSHEARFFGWTIVQIA